MLGLIYELNNYCAKDWLQNKPGRGKGYGYRVYALVDLKVRLGVLVHISASETYAALTFDRRLRPIKIKIKLQPPARLLLSVGCYR
jgi:hypothetical protein